MHTCKSTLTYIHAYIYAHRKTFTHTNLLPRIYACAQEGKVRGWMRQVDGLTRSVRRYGRSIQNQQNSSTHDYDPHESDAHDEDTGPSKGFYAPTSNPPETRDVENTLTKTGIGNTKSGDNDSHADADSDADADADAARNEIDVGSESDNGDDDGNVDRNRSRKSAGHPSISSGSRECADTVAHDNGNNSSSNTIRHEVMHARRNTNEKDAHISSNSITARKCNMARSYGVGHRGDAAGNTVGDVGEGCANQRSQQGQYEMALDLPCDVIEFRHKLMQTRALHLKVGLFVDMRSGSIGIMCPRVLCIIDPSALHQFHRRIDAH